MVVRSEAGLTRNQTGCRAVVKSGGTVSKVQEVPSEAEVVDVDLDHSDDDNQNDLIISVSGQTNLPHAGLTMMTPAAKPEGVRLPFALDDRKNSPAKHMPSR